MGRKLNIKRIIIVGAIVLLIAAVITCVTAFVLRRDKTKENLPLLCEDTAFPETLRGAGGVYTRKLSTYWEVKEVKNGKVIIEDVNRAKGGKEPDDDLGVVDLQGRVMITCDNREVHFTKNGYIATEHYDSKKDKTTYNFYNMGGNCLATLDTVDEESRKKYEGEGELKQQDSAKLSESVDGTVTYFGKYAVVVGKESKDKKTNTCIYEFKSTT